MGLRTALFLFDRKNFLEHIFIGLGILFKIGFDRTCKNKRCSSRTLRRLFGNVVRFDSWLAVATGNGAGITGSVVAAAVGIAIAGGATVVIAVAETAGTACGASV